MKRAATVLVTIALAVGGACRPTGSIAGRVASLSEDNGYVARVVSGLPENRHAYVGCLAESELPVWKQIKVMGSLTEVNVYETTSGASKAPASLFEFLLLFTIPDMRRSTEDHPAFSAASVCELATGVQVRRVEVLAATPNSVHRAGVLRRQESVSTESDLLYTVEYIAVRESPLELSEYRSAMSDYIGPAIGKLVEQGFMADFVALETVSVLFADPDYSHWNQIHLSGYFPDVAHDHFEEFDVALDLALRHYHPEGHGYQQVFDQLSTIRTKPREGEARLLPELLVR